MNRRNFLKFSGVFAGLATLPLPVASKLIKKAEALPEHEQAIGFLDGVRYLELQDSGGNIVSTLAFSDPAFQPEQNGVAVGNPIISDTKADGGRADRFVIRDLHNNEVISGSVSGLEGGGDIKMLSNYIMPGDTVEVSHLRISAM